MADAGDDGFAEFLAQDPSAMNALVLTAQRQEQLLGKVCSLLMDLNTKVEALTERQDRLDQTMQRIGNQGSFAAGSGGYSPVAAAGAGYPTGSFTGSAAGVPTAKAQPVKAPVPSTRGHIMKPPGAEGGAGRVQSAVPAGAAPVLSEEDRRRQEADRERAAQELIRQKQEQERLRAAAAERERIEEERKREAERKKKQELEAKTGNLMGNLLTGGGGGGLFGDDEPKRKSKAGGGLFDD